MTVRRSIAALAVLLCLCLPAVAADRPTEATGSFALSDSDAGQLWSLGFNLDAPLGKVLQVGPALVATGIDPDGGESVYVTSAGGRITLNLTGKNGLFVAAGALYNLGGDAEGYLLTPEIGVKFGGDGGFVRVAVAHPYHYGNDDGAVDLERTEIVGALGIRF